jgi:hypothetical protein
MLGLIRIAQNGSHRLAGSQQGSGRSAADLAY